MGEKRGIIFYIAVTVNMNLEIRYVRNSDKNFWFTLDKHLSEAEFYKKVRDKQGYILSADNRPVGILRYNMFWDNTPFCTLLYIDEKHRKTGCGRALTAFWEKEMQAAGYDWLLVSTRSDEDARYFYEAIGYRVCGCLNAPDQPEELFLSKFLTQ